jgi:chromosome segregation ATPase
MDAGVATVIASLGIGSVVIGLIKAFVDRKKSSADASQINVNTAAEVVEMVRAQMDKERADHTAAIDEERAAVRRLRQELEGVRTQLVEALAEAKELRKELTDARAEARKARTEAEHWQVRVHELERKHEEI